MHRTARVDDGGEVRVGFMIGLASAVVLAGVLTFSVWAKALDPVGFAEQMVRDGMMPKSLSYLAAITMVGIEAALAFALLAVRRKTTLFAVSVVMAGFFLLSLYQYFFPAEDPSSCGCFGNLVQQSPGQHAAVNGVFVLLAGLAWLSLRGRKGKPPAWRWAVPGAGFALGAALAFAAPHLPVDNLATQLRPGVQVATLRIDEIVPELQSGTTLVLLIDRADELTRQEIARVNELVALEPASQVQVFGLAEVNEELEIEFLWTAAPAFEIRAAAWGTLKPLYRTLPRSFLVKDGVVDVVWDEIPDEQTLRRIAGGQYP